MTVTRQARRISDILRDQHPVFSFEFFPPNGDDEAQRLERAITRLLPLTPAFVSVTDRGGSAARGLTRELVTRLGREHGLTAMGHLTCTNNSRDELRQLLQDLRNDGVVNVLTLRGDPRAVDGAFVRPENGFSYAEELVHFVKEEGFEFCLGGGCYPEGHVESEDRDADLTNLKRKVDAGIEFLITQMFLDNAYYFDFVSRARAAGITAPIIPGIMPITNERQVERCEREWGVTLPFRLRRRIQAAADRRELEQVGIAWAVEQCRELLQRGVPGIHFFTLNGSVATRQILEALR